MLYFICYIICYIILAAGKEWKALAEEARVPYEEAYEADKKAPCVCIHVCVYIYIYMYVYA